MSSSVRHASRRAGFTLIELMISMIAGSVVIAGAWYMSETSSRMFNDQLRRAETQMTLRGAQAALTRDIARAGLLAVRTDVEMPNCDGAIQVSPIPISAVTVTPPGALGQMLTLVGNFTTNHQYPLVPEASNPDLLVLEQASTTFAESFANPNTLPPTLVPQRIYDAFLPNPGTAASGPVASGGRMVSVQHLPSGRVQLRYVVSVDVTPAGPVAITIAPALNIGSGSAGCFQDMNGLLIAPISAVRYAIEDPGADSELAQVAGAGATGGLRNALIRRELDMTTLAAPNPMPIPGSARIICDYATVFRVSAVQDVNLTPGGMPLLAFLATPQTPINANAFRSLIIELAANAQAITRASPLTAEQVQRAVASRRGARFEVFMPNMAVPAGQL